MRKRIFTLVICVREGALVGYGEKNRVQSNKVLAGTLETLPKETFQEAERPM